jgi:hypothetical protein
LPKINEYKNFLPSSPSRGPIKLFKLNNFNFSKLPLIKKNKRKGTEHLQQIYEHYIFSYFTVLWIRKELDLVGSGKIFPCTVRIKCDLKKDYCKLQFSTEKGSSSSLYTNFSLKDYESSSSPNLFTLLQFYLDLFSDKNNYLEGKIRIRKKIKNLQVYNTAYMRHKYFDFHKAVQNCKLTGTVYYTGCINI